MTAPNDLAIKVRRTSNTTVELTFSRDIGSQLDAAGIVDDIPVEYLHAMLEMYLQADPSHTEDGARSVVAVW